MKLLGLILLILSVIKIITMGVIVRCDNYNTNDNSLLGLEMDIEDLAKYVIGYSVFEGAIGIVCGLYLSAFQ